MRMGHLDGIYYAHGPPGWDTLCALAIWLWDLCVCMGHVRLGCGIDVGFIHMCGIRKDAWVVRCGDVGYRVDAVRCGAVRCGAVRCGKR